MHYHNLKNYHQEKIHTIINKINKNHIDKVIILNKNLSQEKMYHKFHNKYLHKIKILNKQYNKLQKFIQNNHQMQKIPIPNRNLYRELQLELHKIKFHQ